MNLTGINWNPWNKLEATVRMWVAKSDVSLQHGAAHTPDPRLRGNYRKRSFSQTPHLIYQKFLSDLPWKTFSCFSPTPLPPPSYKPLLTRIIFIASFLAFQHPSWHPTFYSLHCSQNNPYKACIKSCHYPFKSTNGFPSACNPTWPAPSYASYFLLCSPSHSLQIGFHLKAFATMICSAWNTLLIHVCKVLFFSSLLIFFTPSMSIIQLSPIGQLRSWTSMRSGQTGGSVWPP